MNALIWNIRGISNDLSVGRLKFLIKAHKLNMVAIIEPMVDSNRMDSFRKKLKMDYSAANSIGKAHIWFFWKSPLQFVVLHQHEQFLTLCHGGSSDPNFFITIVHAKCSVQERRVLWSELAHLYWNCSVPWLLAGDFNTILSMEEKAGGRLPNFTSMADFNDCITSLGIQDAGFHGSSYTWYNGQTGGNAIWARLDRVFYNPQWLSKFPIKVSHLSREASDHSPLLISLILLNLKSVQDSPFRICGLAMTALWRLLKFVGLLLPFLTLLC